MAPVKPSALVRAYNWVNGLLIWVASTVDYGLSRAFHFLGCQIAARPWLTIIASTLCAAGCLVGFMAFEQDQSQTLFTPTGAQSLKDAAYVSSVYGGSLRSIQVQFFASKLGNQGENILTVVGIKEMQRMWDFVVVDSRVTWEGDEYSFQDVCTPVSSLEPDSCRVRSVLGAFNFNRNGEVDALTSDNQVLDAVNGNFTDVYKRPMDLNSILGGIERGDPSNPSRVTKAEAFASNINLQFSLARMNGERDDPLLDLWQEKVVDLTLEFEDKQAEYLQVYVSNPAAASSESSEAINEDVRLLVVGYVLIIVWAVISLNRNSWVYQKGHIAIWAIVGIVLGAGAAFGLVSACGVKFNLTIQVTPFLLLGLGVDETFVLLGTYFQQDPRMSVQDRIAGCMAAGGTATLTTSITNFIAFIIGYWTDLMALQSFSAFVATGILFIYIFQITFLMGWLALDARREERALRGYGKGRCNPMGCACCWTDTSDIEATPLPQKAAASELAMAGAMALELPDEDVLRAPEKQDHLNRDSPGVMTAVAVDDEFNSPPEYTTPLCIPCPGSKVFDPKHPTTTTLLAGVWLPRITMPWYGKVFIFLVEAAGLAVAIYGCTKVYQDFRPREWFLPEGSWLLDAFRLEDKYFGGSQTKIDFYTKMAPPDESYFTLQDQLAAIPPTVMSSEYMSDTPAFVSWYNLYLEWLNKEKSPSQLDAQGRPTNNSDFMGWLLQWLATPQGAAFEDSFEFNADRTDIISSKMTGYSKQYVDAPWAIKMMKEARQLVAEAAPDLNAIAFSTSFYNIDGYDRVTDLTVRNVITAAVAVFIVMLLLLASFPAAFAVLIMVGLCDVGLFGFMWWANLTFNIITFIILVIAVGISVDYSGHVARAFMTAQGTRQERAYIALKHIGGEVLNGAFTTWLAVIVLAGAKHYIFQAFFKLLFALVVLGIWHGVVFLPVCLSLIGPQGYHQPTHEAAVAAVPAIDGTSESDPELEAAVKPSELGKSDDSGLPAVVKV